MVSVAFGTGAAAAGDCSAPYMALASAGYSGRLMLRDTMLATMAEAIRLSTMAPPSTISITMMKAVSGACVTAARKAVMPMATSGAISGMLPLYWATS